MDSRDLPVRHAELFPPWLYNMGLVNEDLNKITSKGLIAYDAIEFRAYEPFRRYNNHMAGIRKASILRTGIFSSAVPGV